VSSNRELYDFEGGFVFSLLTLLGLRESDCVLDVGCGSLFVHNPDFRLDGGVFLATYYAGETSYAGENWVYPGQVQYRPDDLGEMVAGAGLRMMNFAWPHPTGQQWVMVARSDQVLAEREMDEREALLAERAARRAVSRLYHELTQDPVYGLLVRIRGVLRELGLR
jgi:hypothetical protein